MSKDLCNEMIDEIFTRLPTKSLLRFRSVSKSLHAHIDSPAFIRLHALRSRIKFVCIHEDPCKGTPTRSKFFYTLHSEAKLRNTDSTYIGTTPIEYPFRARSGIRIFGSCNGIICLHEHKKGVALWNPSNRRIISIPDPRARFDAFYGFHFDPVIQDYKIVRVLEPRSYVYTLRTRTWRKVIAPHPARFKFTNVTSEQCVLDGVMHWVEHWRGETPLIYNYRILEETPLIYFHRILTFDFSSEVFSTIELPEPCWETSGLSIIKGSLAVISTKPNDQECKIWVRSKNTASWSVAFDMINSLRCEYVDRFFELAANDDLLLDFRGMKEAEVYDPETRIRSKLASFNDSSYILHVNVCVERFHELLDMKSTSCSKKK